jgi:hypothetical protein
MRLSVILSFSILGTVLIPHSVLAVTNCRSGKCILPPFPAKKPDTTPIKTTVNNVIRNGTFNGMAIDPSNGDDSFIYYLEHVSTTTRYTYKDLNQHATNNSCTNCVPETISFQTGTEWSVSSSVSLSLELALGPPPSPGTLGTELSQTTGLSTSKFITRSREILLPCCSITRYMEESYFESFEFLVKWQQDVLGGWRDMGGQNLIVTRESKGFSMATALGLCSGSPPSLDPGAGGGMVPGPVPMTSWDVQVIDAEGLGVATVPDRILNSPPLLATSLPMTDALAAPAPLPLLGVGAALTFTRRLKQRIQASPSRP